ncbi:hypothetical protein AB0H42_12745 [Nocardia sp. NPDC050799]|uniref:hypothetical protein n=1 Tax=Nocardia sp. NPDC050799 TaxID=3154842 RepID=UPI0033CE4D3C
MHGVAAAVTFAAAAPGQAVSFQLVDDGDQHSTTVRTAKPLPHRETGPVTLLGDAIHTMIPVGNSAAVALRDAAELCRRLTERPGELREAVRAYGEAMLDYGFRAVAESLRAAGCGTVKRVSSRGGRVADNDSGHKKGPSGRGTDAHALHLTSPAAAPPLS